MKIGDEFKIPEKLCGHTGRIVWIGNDGKTISVKCSEPHYEDPWTKKAYGKTEINSYLAFNMKVTDAIKKSSLVKIKKTNIVYVIDVSDMRE